MVSILTIVGTLALVGSSIGYFTFPAAVKMGVDSMINLAENGMVYPGYMNPPIPSQATYHIYAIKNPRGVLKGEKVQLDLEGPYYYEAWIMRDNITFSPDGERVKYNTHRILYLNEEKSADLDKKHWLLNPTLPATLKTIQSQLLDRIPFRRLSEPIIFSSTNLFLDRFKERLIFKRSARQLLQGTKIDILIAVQGLADRFGLGSLMPPGPPENVFGVAHFQNNTFEVIEIFTGVGKTKDKFAEVYKYRDEWKLNFWSDSCNSITGTNGELYKPFMKEGKPLRIFLGNLCRSLYLDPVSTKPVEINDGLMTLEYEVSNRLFLGARNYPKNKCFCKDTRTYDCQYDGLISLSPCFFDSPIFLSRSNMRGVDRRIRSLVNESTLEYDVPEKQSFYMDQTTGLVLKADFSLLSSIKVVRQPYMRDLAAVQNLAYVPFFMVTERVELPYKLTWPLKYMQLMLANYKEAYLGGAVGGAALLLLKLTIFR